MFWENKKGKGKKRGGRERERERECKYAGRRWEMLKRGRNGTWTTMARCKYHQNFPKEEKSSYNLCENGILPSSGSNNPKNSVEIYLHLCPAYTDNLMSNSKFTYGQKHWCFAQAIPLTRYSSWCTLTRFLKFYKLICL